MYFWEEGKMVTSLFLKSKSYEHELSNFQVPFFFSPFTHIAFWPKSGLGPVLCY
jgi:hypothetical protein